MHFTDAETRLKALVAAAGPARVARLRAPTMTVAEADRLLMLLVTFAAGTRVDPTAPTLSVAIPQRGITPGYPAAPTAVEDSIDDLPFDAPFDLGLDGAFDLGLSDVHDFGFEPSAGGGFEASVETGVDLPYESAADPAASTVATARSTVETVMPVLGRVLGDRSQPPRAAPLRGAVEVDPSDESDDDALAGLESGELAGALLRPPSQPAAPASLDVPTPTRAAMDALFDDSEPGLMVFDDHPSESGAGLVLFGDAMDEALDAGQRFAATPGTDPDMAPLPGGGDSGGEREAVLAGAEAPIEGEPDEAPFGFGFGDDEPTVAEPLPALDDEQTQRARRDETLLSSVRKLFGR